MHDAFVSYAHGPRTPLFRGEVDDLLGQWSRQLVQDLSNLIAVKLGTKDPTRQVSLWMDPALAGNGSLSEALKDSVERSALLLVIMSPYYLQSQWCGKEVEWFSAGRRKRRIFVVRAWWTDQGLWPRVLRDCDGLGYSFLPRDEEQADPFGYPCSRERDPDYWAVVMRLASDMAKEIKVVEIERRNGAPGTVARRVESAHAAGGRIFLGFMSETLQEERGELQERLSAGGLKVVPPAAEDPVDEPSLRHAIAAYLRQATALVLMANEYPGLWPKGQEAGFISYQIQRAKEYNIPCYLWLRIDDLAQIRRKEYREYLEALSKQAVLAGLKLQHESLDSFAAHVRESVGTQAPDMGVEQLAVICSNLSEDEDLGQNFREAIREAVQDTRREIFTFDFATSQKQVKLGRLGDRIRDADTVLVLCFDQEWDWARGLIREISGLSELRTGRRAKLLVAGPRDKNEGLYDASVFGFTTVNGLNVDAARLKQILKYEIDKPHTVGNAAQPA